jgi:hypothetical protein
MTAVLSSLPFASQFVPLGESCILLPLPALTPRARIEVVEVAPERKIVLLGKRKRDGVPWRYVELTVAPNGASTSVTMTVWFSPVHTWVPTWLADFFALIMMPASSSLTWAFSLLVNQVWFFRSGKCRPVSRRGSQTTRRPNKTLGLAECASRRLIRALGHAGRLRGS